MPRRSTLLAILLVLGSPLLGAQEPDARTLERAIGTGDLNAVRKVAWAIAQRGTAEAVDILVGVGLESDRADVEEVTRESLQKVPPGEGIDRICHLCTKHPNPVVRDQLCFVVARRPEMEAYKALLTNLYDREETVILAALEAIRIKRHLGSVRHLIRALKYQEDQNRARSAVAHMIRFSLKHLTLYEFNSAREWQSFWDANEKGYKRPRLKEGQKPPPPKMSSGKTHVSTEMRFPKFFGLEIPVQKVVFVLDVSISMKESDLVVEGPPGQEASMERMRIRRVQDELVRLISSLPRDTQFTVISFNSEVRHLSKVLSRATPGHKQRAVRFVRSFDPQGMTHTDEALEAAFAIRPARAIYLLSDGAPVRGGKAINIFKILTWVEKVNRFRRTPVHTIGFKACRKTSGDFLRELARRTKGKYKELP